ncbi:MAG: hypothetical protein RLZZ366_547 [Pseudomonadota bacterium]|jgi:hypothetical protein
MNQTDMPSAFAVIERPFVPIDREQRLSGREPDKLYPLGLPVP